jgi:hypothetical protein
MDQHEFQVGDQVIYDPNEKWCSLCSKKVEVGFIYSIRKDGTIFCRFFRMWSGPFTADGLRTRCNSENTPARFLKPWHYVEQDVVDNIIIELHNEIMDHEK